MRHLAARARTAEVITNPASTDTLFAFGSTVTLRRDDGRVQKYRIVGGDEAGRLCFFRITSGKASARDSGTATAKFHKLLQHATSANDPMLFRFFVRTADEVGKQSID
jgi:hypothetical protein